jgi:hypothetical protein
MTLEGLANQNPSLNGNELIKLFNSLTNAPKDFYKNFVVGKCYSMIDQNGESTIFKVTHNYHNSIDVDMITRNKFGIDMSEDDYNFNSIFNSEIKEITNNEFELKLDYFKNLTQTLLKSFNENDAVPMFERKYPKNFNDFIDDKLYLKCNTLLDEYQKYKNDIIKENDLIFNINQKLFEPNKVFVYHGSRMEFNKIISIENNIINVDVLTAYEYDIKNVYSMHFKNESINIDSLYEPSIYFIDMDFDSFKNQFDNFKLI